MIKSFKEYLTYDWNIISTALTETLGVFHHGLKSLFLTFLVFSTGIGIHFIVFGEGATKQKLLLTSSGIVAVIFLGFLIFFYKLFSIPYKFYREQLEEIDYLKKQIDYKNKSDEVADYLQNAYSIAADLLESLPNYLAGNNKWVNQTLIWYDKTLILIQQYLPADEAFMFESVVPPNNNPTYEQAKNNLNARRIKLRKIIGRYLQNIEDAQSMADK